MHALLERQLHRHLGDDPAQREALRPLLEAISQAYSEFDTEKTLISRSLDEMSNELTSRNRELREKLQAVQQGEQALAREKEEQAALINKLEQAHNQLLQSEKMASIGQLAAGVAHEINNPLGYVNSNLGSMKNYLAELLGIIGAYRQAEAELPDRTREDLERIRKQADLDFIVDDLLALVQESTEGIERVKRIIQDLKDFARADTGQDWQWFDVEAGLNSTLNIANNEIKYRAEVAMEYGGIPRIECLPSQLNQVFMNLLVNAAQAMKEQRGTITVRTGLADGDCVFVEIADNGHGIAPENLKKIFDPFFTTKPVGVGTGLGLSISYGIVEKHRGRIEVDSVVGRGTSFRITLPIRQGSD